MEKWAVYTIVCDFLSSFLFLIYVCHFYSILSWIFFYLYFHCNDNVCLFECMHEFFYSKKFVIFLKRFFIHIKCCWMIFVVLKIIPLIFTCRRMSEAKCVIKFKQSSSCDDINVKTHEYWFFVYVLPLHKNENGNFFLFSGTIKWEFHLLFFLPLTHFTASSAIVYDTFSLIHFIPHISLAIFFILFFDACLHVYFPNIISTSAHISIMIVVELQFFFITTLFFIACSKTNESFLCKFDYQFVLATKLNFTNNSRVIYVLHIFFLFITLPLLIYH
jgi:hypothetical protein